MTPTRRDAIKVAGAASAVALFGGRAIAQEDGDDVLDEEEAAVSVGHFSPDAPDVDVRIDDETVAEDVSFGAVTDYETVETGTVSVEILTTEDDDEGDVVLEHEVTVESTFYTLAVIGRVDDDSLDLLQLTDYDAAQVRLAHFVPEIGPVDVTVEDADLAVFEDVSYGEATDYAAVPPGEYTLEVREAAPENDGDVVETFDAIFESSRAYSAYALGEDEEDIEFALTIDGPAFDEADDPEPVDDRDDVDDDGVDENGNDTDENGVDENGVDDNGADDNGADDNETNANGNDDGYGDNGADDRYGD